MSRLSLTCLILFGCGQGVGETIDRLRGDRYFGEVDHELLADGVNEVDPSTLTVDFLTCDDGGQCAEVDFDGKLNVGGIPVNGSSPQLVEGVTIDGTSLVCETNADGHALRIEGIFSSDRSTLDANVFVIIVKPIFLGAVHLDREEPEPEDTSDTGQPIDTG